MATNSKLISPSCSCMYISLATPNTHTHAQHTTHTQQRRMIMDYLMHNYFGSPEHASTGIWLPLGYTHWVPPASPSHIVPASRRRWLCGFKGTFHVIERKLMRRDFENETDYLNCVIEQSAQGSDRFQYPEELLATAVAICPRGSGPDTVLLFD